MLLKVVKHLDCYSFKQHLFISLIIRLLLIVLSEIQDYYLTLKYTDIDYTIFTDGARHVAHGESPFNRDTYRYTPLLAMILLPNIYCFPQFGKMVFVVFDMLSGIAIYSIVRHLTASQRDAKKYAIIWFYNPLPIIISTRGSAETLVTFFVLWTALLLVQNRLLFAGCVYGFVVHLKLYPVIYAPAIYLILTESKSVYKFFIPNRKKLTFFIFAFFGFMIPTYWSYSRYGKLYLNEAWFYHFYRKDPQHNFSPYFFIYHLTDDQQKHQIIAYCTFIPQALMMIWCAFYYCIGSRNKWPDFLFACFAQTTLFVTLNKVITSQYFLWYFCLLPTVAPFLKISLREAFVLLTIWLLSQGQWLLPAYLYEFQGWDCLEWVWVSSCIFVIINLSLLAIINSRYKNKPMKKQ